METPHPQTPLTTQNAKHPPNSGRTAILAQLRFKAGTDTDLLFSAIEASIEEKEFFLRKAIGWALREYSKTAPQVVADYVASNHHRLSPLSRREAMKVIERHRT